MNPTNHDVLLRDSYDLAFKDIHEDTYLCQGCWSPGTVLRPCHCNTNIFLSRRNEACRHEEIPILAFYNIHYSVSLPSMGRWTNANTHTRARIRQPLSRRSWTLTWFNISRHDYIPHDEQQRCVWKPNGIRSAGTFGRSCTLGRTRSLELWNYGIHCWAFELFTSLVTSRSYGNFIECDAFTRSDEVENVPDADLDGKQE